jgi:hypothetical protein
MSSGFVDEAVKAGTAGTQGYVFKKDAAADLMLVIGGGAE